jgi:F-type H+-transporting ATPase subunit epsilon
MQKGLEIKIVTPDKVVYDSFGVASIVIPTMNGEIKVLPNHIPLIAPLKTGEVVFQKDGVDFGIAVSGGILEVRDGYQVVLLVERGEIGHEIDIARAEDAYKRAEEAMKLEENIADVDFARFESLMEKELNRINIGKKWRR